MKKLFLSSFACKTLDHIQPILPKKTQDLVAAFIPTAADPYSDKEFVDADRIKLVEMGFTVFDLDIKDKTEVELEKLLKPADLVFVAGGNVYYLLFHAQKSGFMSVIERLIKNGVIYVGSSAGAILMCPTVDAAKLFDSISAAPDLQNTDGLGLVNFLLVPHFEKTRYLERMRKTVEEWSKKGHHVYPLTDQQALLIDGDSCIFVEEPMS